ncbi:MAG: type II secretion system protein [Sedimentisphaerales bacterium]
MKRKKLAFTLMELLIVLGIIAILVALLIPALTMVRNMAKETQQKAQLTTIEMGLTAFKNDYGDYPPSHGCDYSNNPPNPDYSYCGAQTLAEALVGWDLLGFHPNSAWRWDGQDASNNLVYDSTKPDNLKQRKGPYLELATANVFRLGNSSGTADDGLFKSSVIGGLYGDRYVICDVFTVRRMTIGSGSAVKTIKAGTPILYYKANTSSKIFDPNAPSNPDTQATHIYNAYDNFYPINVLKSVTVDGSSGSKPHLFGGVPKNLYKLDCGEEVSGTYIYGIRDSKITTIPWPHRPDSYILISAGADGLYGTSDDIRNF